ncbi:MAG: hypothetical protein ACREJ4_00800 [Candidatus Methylomirabilaceae bacterium]
MISSLATRRHRGSLIDAKSKRRFAKGMWTASPMTSVKSHKSSSNSGRRVLSGSASPAIMQTSLPVNGEGRSWWTVSAAKVLMR